MMQTPAQLKSGEDQEAESLYLSQDSSSIGSDNEDILQVAKKEISQKSQPDKLDRLLKMVSSLQKEVKQLRRKKGR